MKTEARFEAKLLENGCLEESKYCSQGLSVFTTSGAKRRSEMKRRCRALVIEEQELQQEEGSNDAEFIAQIYESACAASRAAAIELAR